MLTDDMLSKIPRNPYQIPDASWLAGAAAAIKLAGTRSPRWLWGDFIDDIAEMIEMAGDINPAAPGESPCTGDGSIGSAYDALGGYVSVVGELCPEGLYFRVLPQNESKVASLLSGITLHGSNGDLLVSMYDLSAFTRLVPIHGPLADTIEEEDLM
jgi:hypothetical protein